MVRFQQRRVEAEFLLPCLALPADLSASGSLGPFRVWSYSRVSLVSVLRLALAALRLWLTAVRIGYSGVARFGSSGRCAPLVRGPPESSRCRNHRRVVKDRLPY